MHVFGLWEEIGEKQEPSCSEPALMQASMASCSILPWGRQNRAFSFFLFFKDLIAHEGFGCLQDGVLEHGIMANGWPGS